MQNSLDQLEQQRSRLYQELAETGDFRRGNIGVTYRRCGKKNCACAEPGHPGHGPRHLLTRSVKGKTEGRQLSPGPELEKTLREVGKYKRFVAVSQQIVDVNEQICEARPLTALVEDSAAAERGKKGGPSKRRSRPSSQGK